MPSILAFINITFLTPMVSVLFMVIFLKKKISQFIQRQFQLCFNFKSAATLVIILLVQDPMILINIGVLAEYLFIALSVAGLLWLRKIQPLRPRPIRVSKLQIEIIYLNIKSFNFFFTYKGELILPNYIFNCMLVYYFDDVYTNTNGVVYLSGYDGDGCASVFFGREVEKD